MALMINKIISGGQTGVDQAALDAAIFCGIPYGGRCPQGRINENGKITATYSNLKEIDGNFKNEQENYDARTLANIKDSTGTLIFVPKIPLPTNIKDGTLLTIEQVIIQKKPYIIIDLAQPYRKNEENLIAWINDEFINILNIAGPRESSNPGIYAQCLDFLKIALKNYIDEAAR